MQTLYRINIVYITMLTIVHDVNIIMKREKMQTRYRTILFTLQGKHYIEQYCLHYNVDDINDVNNIDVM